MSACCLCMVDKSLSPKKYIQIQSEEGCQLNVASIVIKHFGFEANESEKLVQVCRDCWKIVSDFHNLYEIVSTTQSVIQEKKYILIDNDPLPMTQEVFSESEKEFTCSVQNPVNTENNFFCPEIKIEEHELDQLPKIEIIENTNAIEDRISPSPVRVSSRLKQLKRVNNEDKIALYKNITNTFNHLNDVDVSENVFNQKRRRGRPRKEKQKDPTEVDLSLETKRIIVKSEEIIESIGDDSNDDDIDYFAEMEDESDESDSNNSSNSSCSDDREKSSQHQYAVIPKRVVVRPKKYKKRDKPLVPPVRMSREEIERRKAQQEEYDRTIEKFFNNKFACSICNLLVHNFTDMVRHHRISHNIDQGYMTCCGRKFKQRKTMAEHALVHWNPEHFKCETCHKVFHTSRLLEAHEQTHTNSGEPQDKIIFQCDKCPKSFASKSTFDYHNLSKHMPKSEFKFACPQCNKKLLTERKLNNHLKTAHDPENAIICDKCGKQMRTKHSLKKHQDLIHSDMPRPEPVLMQCQICGTWLKDIRGLKQHMKSIHIESAGEHRCHICSKVSPNARALRRHIYHNHECERKFKCTMCEKAFKRPQELREHTSTHTGEVLYTCPNCPMTFFCSANMYKHRQRLHRAQYEADKNQPRPPNILQAAVGATAAMKVKLMQGQVTPSLVRTTNKVEMKYH